MNFKFGVRAHDLGKGNPQEIANMAKKIGIPYLQLVFKKALTDYSYSKDYVENVKRALEYADIKVAMLGAYFNPVHSNKETVESGKNEFKCNLAIAKSLGTDIVGSETGSYNDSPWTYVPKNHTQEGFEESLAVFKELQQYANEVGSHLCIEAAYAHVIASPSRLKAFVDAIGPDTYVTVDLYNLIYIGNHESHRELFLEALETFKERIRIIHLKDYVIEEGKIKQVAPGLGNFDYPYMLKLISEYCPNAVLVFEGVSEPDLSKSYRYLLKLAESL